MKKNKFLFIHVPKCGGHSVNSGFYHMFGMEQILQVWSPDYDGDVTVEDFPNLPISKIRSYAGITGHLFFPIVAEVMGEKLLREEYFVCTLIRDPIRQVLSLWNYINDSPGHPDHSRVRQMNLRQFVTEYTANQQSIFLCGDVNGTKALDLILKHFDLVRPLSMFQSFIETTAKHFGKNVPKPKYKNKTEKLRTTIEQLDDEMLQLMKQQNSEDLILYNGVMQSIQESNAA